MRKTTSQQQFTLLKKSFLLLTLLISIGTWKNSYGQEIIASQYFNEDLGIIAESNDSIPVISPFVGAISTIDNWPFSVVVKDAMVSTTDETFISPEYSLRLLDYPDSFISFADETGAAIHFSEIDITEYDQVTFEIGYASNGLQKQNDDLVLNYEYKLDGVWVQSDTIFLVNAANNTPIEFGETIDQITQATNPFLTPPIPNDATHFRATVLSVNKGSKQSNSYYLDDVILKGNAPEIAISGNDIPIENGQTETDPSNYTDFENVVVNEAFKIRDFEISNLGNLDLDLNGDPIIVLTGDTDDFSITVNPITPIVPGESSFFTVVFQPKSEGNKSITVSIDNNDNDEHPYTFVIVGAGISGDFTYCDPTDPPIPNNNASFYINNVSIGSIDNTSTYQNPTRYTYFSQFTTNLNRGASYFSRIFNETLVDSDSGVGVWIDYNRDGDFNDANEEVYTNLITSGADETNIERTFNLLVPELANPGLTRMRIAVQEGSIPTPCGPFDATGEVEDYDVTIVNIVSEVPEAIVFGNGIPIENGDTTPELIDNTDFGLKELFANPQANSFTVVNAGGIDLTLDDPSPYVVISGDTDDFILTKIPSTPITPISGSNFEITFNPQSVGIKSAIVSIANNDDSNNPYTFSISGEGYIPVPEIEISGNGVLITNGDSTPRTSDNTDFGNIEETIGVVSRTFLITNEGDIDLLLYNTPLVQITGNTGDFKLTTAPSNIISPTDGTTFTVEFNPLSAGQKTATISISNNDEDEDPFIFDITGYGIPFDYCGISEPLEFPTSLSYYISNVNTDIIDNTTTFEVGRYSYYPAITPDYTMGSTYDMSVTVETEVNEEIGVAVWIDYNKDGDFFDPGEEIFTDLIPGSGETSIVRSFNFLIPTNLTEGITMMRVATHKGDFPLPCGPFLQSGEIEDYLVNFVGEEISTPRMNIFGNGTSIANGDNTPNVNDDTYFGSIEVSATPKTHEFTIKNEGALDLALNGDSPYIKLTGDTEDFSIVSIPTSPIAPNGTTTFSLEFSPTTVGERSVVIEILNNDPVRSPYIFRVQGNGQLLNDYDGDLVLDENDADDDNDGILDVQENSDCNETVAYKTSLFVDDFGTQSLEVGTPSTSSPYLGSYEYQPLSVGTVPITDNSLTANRYSVFNNIQEAASWASSTWQTVGDHTNGGAAATEGRMLIINTNQDLNSEYYRRDILSNIEIGVPVDVSISALNLDTNISDNDGRILPNFEVIIEQGGSSFSVITTGNIPRVEAGDVRAWRIFSGSYTPTVSDPITIVIVDRAAQGNGNELAIDDISISQTQIICDVDEDGIPNKLDLDSDNDGIFDSIEAGGLDANNNGLSDDDNDNQDNTATGGIPSSAGAGLIPTTTEGEHEDYIDLDSDNDGCSDANEAYGSPNADGGDDGKYGEGAPSILSNGTVSEALYIKPEDRDGNTVPDYIQHSKSIVNVVREPFDAVVLEGTNVILSIDVATEGEGTNISYQWQEDQGDGFVDLANDGIYSGVNSLAIRIENVTYEMSGYRYRVLVKSESFVCDDDVVSAEAELIIQASDIVVTKLINNDNPYEGDEIYYSISAFNQGPNDATNVSLVDILPIEVTYLDDNSEGTYDPVTGLWTIGNLSANSTETLIIAAKVNVGISADIVRNEITEVNLDQLDLSNSGDVLFADFFLNEIPAATDDTATTDEDIAININVLSNDSFGGDGPSVGPISIISGTTSEGGTVVVNDAGTPNDPTDDTIDYAPKPNFNGTDTFEYKLFDLDGDEDIGLVTITVNSVNDTPLAVDDNSTMLEDGGSINIQVVLNDDFGGDGPSAKDITTPSPTTVNGSTVVVGDSGTPNNPVDDIIIFTPAQDFNGQDTFTYTIEDSNGDMSTANVSVTITPVDDTPQAENDLANTTEDVGINIDVLINDNFGGDGPGVGPIEVITSTTAKGGTVVVDDNGSSNDPTDDSIDYTPALDFYGVDNFDYNIKDVDGDISVASVTITVNSVNDLPTAVDDAATVDEDDPATIIPVAYNDDFGGDGPSNSAITISNSTTPNGGTVTVDDNATPNNPTDDNIVYTPFLDFNGTDHIDYTIEDSNGDSSTATLTISVNPINDLPMANDDTTAVDEDSGTTSINVTDNDDFGGDGPSAGPIELISGSTQEGGIVVVNDNGTPSNPTDDLVDYEPKLDFNGVDRFDYRILDSNGDVSTATVTVTVYPINDLPFANDDSAVTSENSSGTIIVVLSNDDFGGDGPSSTTIVLASVPSNGVTIVNDNGTPDDPTDDTIHYAPNPAFDGVDSFTYTIADSNGDTSTATVNVTISSVDVDPVASDDSFQINEDSSLNKLDILANDSFGGNGPSSTSIILATSPSNGVAVVDDNGSPTNPTDDSINYTPNANYNGTDSFTYTIADSDGDTSTASVSLTILSVNDVPTAVDDAITVAEDSGLTSITVTNNDDFGGDGPSNGTVTIASSITPNESLIGVNDNGTPSNPTDDLIDYIPALDFNGTDSFDYQITDSNGDKSTATVTVTVTPVDDFPEARNDAKFVFEDSGLTTIDVTANDDFGGDGPSSGTIILSNVSSFNGGTIAVNDSGTPNDPSDDGIDYTPDGNFHGTDNFDYEIADSDGDTSTATVFVEVISVNDVPTAIDDVTAVDEDSVDTRIDVLINDDFGGDGPNMGSITLPEGAFTGQDDTGLIDPTSNDGLITVDDNGTPTDPTDDSILYSPAPDFHGTDAFIYSITDANGDESVATVTITVNSINDLPIALDDAITINEDAPLTNIAVLTNDDFGGDGPSKSPITITASPTAFGGIIAVNDGGTPDDPTDDTVDYTPAPNFYGLDSFDYVIEDSDGDQATAKVTITILPINDVPLAEDDAITLVEDSDVTIIDVTINDDFGGDGPSTGTITIPISQQLVGSTLTVNDNNTPSDPTDDKINYTPRSNFNGVDTFVYAISDIDGDQSTATVTVTVTPVTDLFPDFYTTNEDNDITLDIFANDNDIDPDSSLSITSSGNGSISIDTNETPEDVLDDILIYTPNEDYNGYDLYTYEICSNTDPTHCFSAEIYIAVLPKLDVENDVYFVKTNTINFLDLYSNDNDIPDNGTITFDNPVNGLLSYDDRETPGNPSDDLFTYTPNEDYIGHDSFTYTICDNENPMYCETATVDISVLYIGANDDEVVTDEDVAVQINFLANDLDVPENGTITLELSENGTVDINDNGTPEFIRDDTFTYTPNPEYNGTDSFIYTTCDLEEYCTSATVSITIHPIIDALDDAASTYENMPFEINILTNDNDISTNATLELSSPITGDIEIIDQGTPDILDDMVLYTPMNGYVGTDNFSYTLCDIDGNCSTATVEVTVIEIAKLTDDYANTEENIPVNIFVLDNDEYIPNNGILTVSAPVNGTVVINDNGTPSSQNSLDDYVVYTPNNGFFGFDEFTYTICDPLNNEICETALVTVEVEEGFKASDFILPNEPGSTKKGFGFSPNGDGKNDMLRIHSDDGQHFIEEVYPNFRLEIFNRWGQHLFVYTHNGDPNSPQPGWDGKSNAKKETTINSGNGVPAGTYFYTVYFNDGIRKPYTGWIYLSN